MDLRHLRYFVAVAEELSITRAAARLQMSQPPLTRQIRQMEAEMGVQLLDRTSGRIKLTAAGQYFYTHAVHTLEYVDITVQTARRIGEGKHERFEIGLSLMTLNGVLPDIIGKLQAIFPNLDIGISEVPSSEILEALKTGRINVGFGRVPTHDKTLASELLLKESLAVAMASRNPLAASKQLKLEKLVDEPLVLYGVGERPRFDDHVLDLFQTRGLPLRRTLQADGILSAIRMVSAGFGVTLVPDSFRHFHMKGVDYRALADKDASSPVYLSYRKKDSSLILERLRTFVAEAVKPKGRARSL